MPITNPKKNSLFLCLQKIKDILTLPQAKKVSRFLYYQFLFRSHFYHVFGKSILYREHGILTMHNSLYIWDHNEKQKSSITLFLTNDASISIDLISKK